MSAAVAVSLLHNSFAMNGYLSDAKSSYERNTQSSLAVEEYSKHISPVLKFPLISDGVLYIFGLMAFPNLSFVTGCMPSFSLMYCSDFNISILSFLCIYDLTAINKKKRS